MTDSPRATPDQGSAELSDERIYELAKEHFGGSGHELIWRDDPGYARACSMEHDARWSLAEVRPEQTLAFVRAILAAATQGAPQEVAVMTGDLSHWPALADQLEKDAKWIGGGTGMKTVSTGMRAAARMLRALASQGAPTPAQAGWEPIKTAPRDGTNILLAWGQDGVSQGKYIPGLPKPWQFIDTNDGITWLINHAVDNEYGPTHWLPMPQWAKGQP